MERNKGLRGRFIRLCRRLRQAKWMNAQIQRCHGAMSPNALADKGVVAQGEDG